MPRWLAHLLVVVGWLLTPVLAWSASYIGLWAGALVATGFTRPVTMLVVAGAVATLCGFTALFIWCHAPGPPPPVPSHGTTHVGGAARRCRG